jgi:hypothetical protein
VESGQFLVLEIDRTALIQCANPALNAVRGTDAGDEIGNSLLFLVHSDDRSGLSERVRETFSGRESEPVFARLLGSRDAVMAVRWSLFAVRNQEGAVTSAICVGVDFTAQFESVSRREQASRTLTELRQAIARLEEENLRMRSELETRGNAARRADDHGPIPGLDETGGGAPPTLAQLERRYIIRTLEQTKGRVSGAKGAAAVLGMHPNTLRSRMEKLGIERVG